MFELEQCAAHTYYLRCFSNVGIYDLGGGEVVLIDSCDHKKSTSDLDKALCARGWRVKMILNTHSHVDHVAGNRFFTEKYGCEVYASHMESFLVEETAFESEYYFLGIPTDRNRNYFFKPFGVAAKELTADILPPGFEVLPLPGHSRNMIGIKTPDDVWFLGDALLARESYQSYKLPSFYHINNSIETARMLANLPGAYFVPSHAPASKEIRELALFNAAALEDMKAFILARSDKRSFEDLFACLCADLELTMDVEKYAKVSLTVKCFLQSLIEDGALDAHMENGRLIYDRVG